LTFSWFSFLLGGLINWAGGLPQLLPGAYSRAPVGNDRPALNGQLGEGKTKVIEEFIAASREAVRELSTGHQWTHSLDLGT